MRTFEESAKHIARWNRVESCEYWGLRILAIAAVVAVAVEAIRRIF